MHILELAPELLSHLLTFVDVRDLMRYVTLHYTARCALTTGFHSVARVCTQLRDITRHDALWERHCTARWSAFDHNIYHGRWRDIFFSSNGATRFVSEHVRMPLLASEAFQPSSACFEVLGTKWYRILYEVARPR